jgi:hypothetical protein
MRPDSTFDLIWSGSVLTHLPAEKSIRLLERFLEWLAPNGVAVVSIHGRAVHKRLKEQKGYLQREIIPVILEGYEGTGYGYSDYRGQSGYGVSLSNPSWTIKAAQSLAGCRIVAYSEQVWDNHHDILAIQRVEGDNSPAGI